MQIMIMIMRVHPIISFDADHDYDDYDEDYKSIFFYTQKIIKISGESDGLKIQRQDGQVEKL